MTLTVPAMEDLIRSFEEATIDLERIKNEMKEIDESTSSSQEYAAKSKELRAAQARADEARNRLCPRVANTAETPDAEKVGDSPALDSTSKVRQTRTVRLVDPKEFKHGNNFAQWCSRFRRDLKIGRIERESAIETFLNSLDDRTAEKLEPVADKMSSEERKDPEKFITLFEETIYPQAEIRSLRVKLTNGSLKQEETEDVDSFAARIRNIAHRAYPDTASRLEPSLNAFLNGLQEDLYDRIISPPPRDFEEAVTTAITYEKMRRSRESAIVLRMNQNQNVANNQNNNGPTTNTGRWRDNPAPNWSNQGYGQGGVTRQRRETRTCFACGRVGHIQRNCWSRNQQPLNANRAGPNVQNTGPRQ